MRTTHAHTVTVRATEATRQQHQRGWGCGGSLYGEVQCIMGNGYMGAPIEWQTNRQMDGNRTLNYCTFYVFSNEGIFHDVSSVRFQYFLKFSNIIILICTAKYKDMYLFFGKRSLKDETGVGLSCNVPLLSWRNSNLASNLRSGHWSKTQWKKSANFKFFLESNFFKVMAQIGGNS